MATIAMNVSLLRFGPRVVKGQEFITMGTGNANVPGNAALITKLTASQAAIIATNDEYEEALQIVRQKLVNRDAAMAVWLEDVRNLAAYTESTTAGDAEKILSAGFDIRSSSPPQPVGQVQNVKVKFNGMPGYSVVLFKKDPNAEAYVLERSPEPITEASWVNVGTVTTMKYEGNGTTPGLKYWYRVAGVNKLGQGPWSEPALRPVM